MGAAQLVEMETGQLFERKVGIFLEMETGELFEMDAG